MRKIILLAITIIFSTQINSFSQALDELYAKLDEDQKEEIYLIDFEFNLKPNKEQRHSIVLSKRTLYGWYAYLSEKKQIQITLYDDYENLISHNKSTDEGLVSFTTRCNKTGIYHLFIKNTSEENVNSTILLTFAGRFKPKDIEKIIPKVEQQKK